MYPSSFCAGSGCILFCQLGSLYLSCSFNSSGNALCITLWFMSSWFFSLSMWCQPHPFSLCHKSTASSQALLCGRAVVEHSVERPSHDSQISGCDQLDGFWRSGFGLDGERMVQVWKHWSSRARAGEKATSTPCPGNVHENESFTWPTVSWRGRT